MVGLITVTEVFGSHNFPFGAYQVFTGKERPRESAALLFLRHAAAFGASPGKVSFA